MQTAPDYGIQQTSINTGSIIYDEMWYYSTPYGQFLTLDNGLSTHDRDAAE
jgi:hypothetical protein